MNLENRKFFQYKAFLFLKNFPPLFLCCSQAFELDHMAHEYTDDDPHASEYAGKGPPNDSDSDEGLCVETNANVTKLLTTRGSRNSSTMDKLEHLLHTLRVRKEDGTLPEEESNRFESLVEKV